MATTPGDDLMSDLQQMLWNQFGGALQMLENAVTFCPEEVWGDERHPQVF